MPPPARRLCSAPETLWPRLARASWVEDAFFAAGAGARVAAGAGPLTISAARHTARPTSERRVGAPEQSERRCLARTRRILGVPPRSAAAPVAAPLGSFAGPSTAFAGTSTATPGRACELRPPRAGRGRATRPRAPRARLLRARPPRPRRRRRRRAARRRADRSSGTPRSGRPLAFVDRRFVGDQHPVGAVEVLRLEDLVIDLGRVVDDDEHLGGRVEVGPGADRQLVELEAACILHGAVIPHRPTVV